MNSIFDRELTFTKTITMVTENCINCGVSFAMPSDLKDELFKSHKSFYCPNGHSQHYVGETEEQRLRRQLQEKENQLAQVATAKIQLQSELDKTQRQLKRVHRGTCPCCNRTFQDLKRHMESKHPELIPANNNPKIPKSKLKTNQ